MKEAKRISPEEQSSFHLVQIVEVVNNLGLHTRPATYLVQLLQSVKSEVFFTYQGETVMAKSILNILMLAVPKNAFITITIIGEDASVAMEVLLEAFANQFGEI